MELRFFKYHGAGNDFIILDDREEDIQLDNEQVVFLCDRRFGIGADGLMRLQNSEDYDFKMLYYNSDGKRGTMCGNGGRCMIAFANHIGLIDRETIFEAVDGLHEGTVEEYGVEAIVRLKMKDIGEVKPDAKAVFLDTGSPHHIEIVDKAEDVNVVQEGRHWRHHSRYAAIGGTNANFVEVKGEDTLFVRTFERGVEDETFSCGTGVTAAAITLHALKKVKGNSISIETRGGDLQVDFNEQDSIYSDVYLQGPAAFVFQGIINY